MIMSILACFCFLILIPNYASSISFNFTNITQENIDRFIKLDGDATYNSSVGIKVSHERNVTDDVSVVKAGQATYTERLHLWHNGTSTDLASFSTSFTFVIDSNGNHSYGDGLTFFLAHNYYGLKGGGAIGLPYDVVTKARLQDFVAVEFDSYGANELDPVDPVSKKFIGDHVGINNNSMTSAVYKKWFSNIPEGKECRALINYDSDSKNLSVSYTSVKDNLTVWETGLHYIIDLSKVLPEWVIFGFSASTGNRYEKNEVKSWTFSSTKLKVDETNEFSPKGSDQGSNRNVVKGKSNKLLKVVGAGVLVIVFVILGFFLWRRRKNKSDRVQESVLLEMNNELESGASMPRRFSYNELARSTSDFAETEKLGEGGFGSVYKGFLKDLSICVAVKRVSKTSKQGIKEYASEVKVISRLRHKNLVQLIGWCHEKGELLLVYEFMENGSLDLHIFKRKTLLTWNTRYKIAQGLASALLYLHEEWEQCVLHRDIKSSNVMLDSNFDAKLGDFGLAKLVDHEKGGQTTRVAGTLGYMAPEYVVTGRATKDSDVYSFGVVALEIACGRKVAPCIDQENQIRLLEWVWELYGNDTLLEAVDPSLESEFEEEEIRRLIMIGLWCVHPAPELRPSMREAIKVLNSEAPLPLLPSNMPVASYLAPSLSDFCSTGQYETSSGNIRTS